MIAAQTKSPTDAEDVGGAHNNINAQHHTADRTNGKAELWPHQVAAIQAVMASVEAGDRAGLWSMPTGSGKTRAFVEVAGKLRWRTLILVHRDELIRQTVEAFAERSPSLTVGVVKGDRNEIDEQVVVASVQSLHAARLRSIPRDRFGLIVADECHHAPAPTWVNIFEHFECKYLLGCSATPERLDGKGLDELFGSRPIYNYALRQAVDDGILARPIQYGIETGVSVDGVAVRAGDYAVNELSQAVNTEARNHVIVEAFEERGGDRRAVAFCVDVAHAEDLAGAFRDAGYGAESVCGAMKLDERRDTIARFRRNEFQVLTNCQLLTEGWDDAGVNAILMARPTKSRSLYVQCIGRGLRQHPGKPDCLILDFVDNSSRHRLVTALDLFGKTDLTDADGADIIEVVDADVRERDEQLHLDSIHPIKWRAKFVSPWPQEPSLDGYVIYANWQDDDASEKQIGYLEKRGLAFDRELTKGEACHLIDRSKEFEAAYGRAPTPKQVKYLKWQRAYDSSMSFEDASAAITRLKENAA